VDSSWAKVRSTNYFLCPKLLKCFDWNTNINEYVRNL
jgi:hypothetical protein